MIPFIYRCPKTGQNVQGLFAEEAPEGDNDNVFETVTCLACNATHLVNRSTGKILGADDD